MAQQIPVSLFYRAEGYSVGAVVFDLVLQEAHSLQAEATLRPVQDGSTISDHIQNRLRQGSFSGYVSNWSLSQVDTNTNKTATAKLQTAVAVLGAEAITGYPPPANRAQEAYEKLKELHAAKQPVKLVLGLDTYDSVVITDISASRDADSGDAQVFEISFQQIRVVSLKQKVISTATKPLPPKKADAKGKQAQSKKTMGKQTGVKS